VLKTTGELQNRARRWASISGAATVALIVIVSLWTPFLDAAYWGRWFGWPQVAFVAPVPLLVAVAVWILFRGLRRGQELPPFLAALALFALGYLGLLVSFYPYLVPTSVTFREAAAPDKSLGFLLAGSVVLLPMILAYTAYSYWVFRGKVDASTGYH
jgi:cytochrome d ubiquinol oxidase subunit II